MTFTIVTCATNAAIAAIHDPMPVVLDEGAADDWMSPRKRDSLSLKRLLVPAPSDLLAMLRASPLVNTVKNDGPAILEVGAGRRIQFSEGERSRFSSWRRGVNLNRKNLLIFAASIGLACFSLTP